MLHRLHYVLTIQGFNHDLNFSFSHIYTYMYMYMYMYTYMYQYIDDFSFGFIRIYWFFFRLLSQKWNLEEKNVNLFPICFLIIFTPVSLVPDYGQLGKCEFCFSSVNMIQREHRLGSFCSLTHTCTLFQYHYQ